MNTPFFEPGSGWYRIGAWAPGSMSDIRAMQDAAFRCVVYRMRRRGVPLKPDEVLASTPTAGGIICTDRYTGTWFASLLELPGMTRQQFGMHDVTLVRARGGFRQYSGREWDERATESWRQTWFCAPNAEAARVVLEQMAATQRADVFQHQAGRDPGSAAA